MSLASRDMSQMLKSSGAMSAATLMSRVLGMVREIAYAHPVFDRRATAAQQELPALQGLRHTWYCGAWTRYGFHEDGMMSGTAVVEHMRTRGLLGKPGAVA